MKKKGKEEKKRFLKPLKNREGISTGKKKKAPCTLTLPAHRTGHKEKSHGHSDHPLKEIEEEKRRERRGDGRL